jgi:DNA repair proteins
MKNPILASESFSRGKNHYFFDLQKAGNGTNYLNITRSVYQGNEKYLRVSVPFFAEDLFSFVQAFTSIFQSAAYLEAQDQTAQDLYRQTKERREKGIKSWAPEKRPREKMLELGVEMMSNAELLAMTIGSGSPDETAVQLAERILNSVGGKLHKVSGLSYEEFFKFKGMGMAKASAIIAALEISRRIYMPMTLIKIA